MTVLLTAHLDQYALAHVSRFCRATILTLFFRELRAALRGGTAIRFETATDAMCPLNLADSGFGRGQPGLRGGERRVR